MRKLKLFFACLLMAVLSIGQMWGADPVTYAAWTFTSDDFPANKTDFEATSGSFKTGSTFYLDGTGSQWNTGAGKGYAFTAVDYIYLTLTLGDDVPAGTEITFAADMFYNKATNAPMTGFTVTVSVDGGAYGTTGLDVTSISLSTSKANKAIVYTTQTALEEDATITLKYTQTGKVGAGQGFFSNITITAVEGSGSTPPSCTDPTSPLSITNANTATIGTPLTLTTAGGNGGTITWSVAAGTGTASVEENVLTPLTKGKVTVTATQEVTDGKCGAAPTQEITISKAAPAAIDGGIVDELKISTFNVTGGYTAFTGKQASNTGHSSAVYAGTVARNGNSTQYNIQLNSGQTSNKLREIATSTSGGYAKRVYVTWATQTDITNDGRKLTVYGSNTAYSGSETAATGTKIGDIVYVAGDTYEYLDIATDYKYIQIVASAAIYMDEIDITWVPIPKYAVTLETEGCSLDVQKDATSISSGDEFEEGQTLTVSYSANTGYENASLKIKKASDNSDVTGAVLSGSTITVPDYAIKVVATATKKNYTVALPATNGHITVGGNTETSIDVAHGETAQLTAVADDGYNFNGWTSSDGTKVALSGANDNPVTITVTGAATVTASFISSALDDPELSWSSNTATVVKGQTPYSLPSLTNEHGLTIAYESSNTDVAEIATNGAVTIKGVGETTITASNEEEGGYAESSKSYTLTVKGRVTWHAKKAGVDATTYADYVKDAVPTKPTGDFIASCHSSISLVGWTTEDYKDYSDDDDAPSELYTASDDMPGVTDNVDYYAVWGVVEEGGWSETALGNISSTDVVVIVGYDGEDYYGIKSNGTSGSPIAVGITVENGKITSTFDDENNNIKWNITGNATDGYSFYVNGGTANDRLYCSTNATSSGNKSWRVGNPASGVNRYTLEWSAEKNTMATKDESTARYLCLYPSGPDWRSYVAGSVTTTNLKFYKHSAGSTTDYTTNCLEPLTVATPAFTPDGSAAYYTSAQDVEISCATGSSTIYYTTDGTTTPDKTTGTPYTGAIHVETTTTIKAIAYVGDVASEVAEATFTINMPLTGIPAIFSAATTTATTKVITFNHWVVSGVNSDGTQAFLTDGTNGLILYHKGVDMELAVGNTLSGTKECSLILFNGAAELQDFSTDGLTIGTGGVVTPVSKSIAELSGVNTGAPVIINNVTYTSSDQLLSDGNNTIKPFTTLYDYTTPTNKFENNKIYNVTGIYQQYYATKEILPRSAADIVKLSKEQQTITWYVSNAQAEAIGTSYTLDNKDVAFAPVCVSNSTGAKTYQSSNTEVATINENTGVIEVLGNGVTTITCNVVGDENYVDGSKAFTLKVGIGEASWVATTWATDNSIAANAKMADNSPIAIDANISMTWAKAEGSNDPIYHSDGEGRLYQKNTLTITASNSKQITRIEFHFTGNNTGYISANEGTYSNGVWTGFAPSVTFTNAPGASGAKIKSIDIEYAQGTTTTLVIDDMIILDNASATDIVFSSNKPGAVVTYSDYDEDVITIADGKITPVAIGNTTVKASIAAEAPYSSVSITFNVRVKSSSETVENVVILSQFGDKWLAMKHDFTAVEVEKAADGTIIDLTCNEADITWVMTADGASAMFQQPSTNKYLAVGSSNALTLVDEATTWTLSDDGYYYNVSGRTFLYQGTGAKYKNYSANNHGKSADGGYSEYATFVTPVFANRVEVRTSLSDGKWGTICPKQEVKYPSGAVFYQLTYMEQNPDNSPYKFFFDEIAEGASLEAGKPYLFIAEGEVIKGIKVGPEAADGDHAYNGFVGYLGTSNKALASDDYIFTDGGYNYYGLQNNIFKLIGSGQIVNERAYVEVSPDRAPSTTPVPMPAYSRRRLVVGAGAPQVTTGTENIEASEAPVKVMIDGQLFILRGEKMYDATGRLVK